MTSQPDALVVHSATWLAAAAACYLVVALTRMRRTAVAVTAAALATCAAGGVALAGGRGEPSPVPSLDWAVRHGTATTAAERVLVRRGDCLWAITARTLPRPSAALVAAGWPRWWQRNRAVIGPDPDLIRPGLLLHAPGQPTRRR